MTFAERLRYYREKANYSQKELAEIIHIPFGTYNNYETKGYEPKIDILIKLATALNIDVNTLVGFQQTSEEMLTRYLQQYMDVTNNVIIKVDNGYLVFLNSFHNISIPKFVIPSNELETIVNTCRNNTEQYTSTVFKAIKEIEVQYFCYLLSIELGNYLDKINTISGTETQLINPVANTDNE